jgi:hypothetical protein
MWRIAPLAALVMAAVGCASGTETVGQTDASHPIDSASQTDAAPPSDAASGDGGQSGDAVQSDTGGGTRTVSGTLVGHYLDDTTTTSLRDDPADLSTSTIAALVADGAAYTVYAGTGDASGHFTIADVPAGTYMLAVDEYYYVMSTDTPNLDYYAIGRANITWASAATTVKLGSAGTPLTGLNAWNVNDTLLWYCSNLDSMGFLDGSSLSNGATQLTGLSFDLYGDGDGLLPTTADQPKLLDLAFATGGSGNQYYVGLKKVYTPTPFNLASGGTTTLSGAFVAGTHSQSTSVSFKRSEFHAGGATIFPSATVYTDYVSIYAQPGGLTYGAYAYATADLMDTLAQDAADTDINYGSTTYDNPFPSSYGLLVSGVSVYKLGWTAAGATTAKTLYGSIASTMSLADFTSSSGANSTMHALVSPPRSIQLNGSSATTALTGVTTTPLLGWTAPATGTASTYLVTVYQAANSSGTTTTARVAVFYTNATSLRIPSGLLTSGNQYGFRVAVVSDPNNDYALKPQQSSLPYGYASAFTALATP